jgi:hypothetical protein
MAGSPTDDISTVRIPFIGNPTNRDTVTSKDQRFINAYFDVVKRTDGEKTFLLVKRPGYAQNTAPSASATGRGIYSWRGDLYTVYGTKIYKNTTDLGVTLTTSTGICGINETRPGAATQYLAINDGAKLYLISTTGVVTTVVTMPANTGHLIYFDQYFFVLTTTNAIYQCNADDPTTWDSSKFIFSQMYNGSGIGLAQQNNLLVAFSDRHIQAFNDSANVSGSILSNVEQAAQQIGAASGGSIIGDEALVLWVSNSRNGGYSVMKLDGLSSLSSVSTSGIERLLRGEGTSISSCIGNMFRISGHKFYALNLISANRTLLYEINDDTWLEWQASDGSSRLPIVAFAQHGNALIGQHETNGKTYTFSESTYQDDGSNFTVLGRFRRMDLDDNRRKFIRKAYLLGDIQSSTTNISLQYSDDDYATLSTARILDMSKINVFADRLGNFKRRAWQISYTGANPLRLEGLELKLRIGTN